MKLFSKKSSAQKLTTKTVADLNLVYDLKNLVDSSPASATEVAQILITGILGVNKKSKFETFNNLLIILECLVEDCPNVQATLFIDENLQRMINFFENSQTLAQQKLPLLAMIYLWSHLFIHNYELQLKLVNLVNRASSYMGIAPSVMYLPLRPQYLIISPYAYDVALQLRERENPNISNDSLKMYQVSRSQNYKRSSYMKRNLSDEKYVKKIESDIADIFSICQTFEEILISIDHQDDLRSNDIVQLIRDQIKGCESMVQGYINVAQDKNTKLLDLLLQAHDKIVEAQATYDSIVDEHEVEKVKMQSLKTLRRESLGYGHQETGLQFDFLNHQPGSSRAISHEVGPNGKNHIL